MKLYISFIITSGICFSIGFLLEFIYFVYLKNLVWILLVHSPQSFLIYPPPGIVILINAIPYLGGLFLGFSWIFLIIGLVLFLKTDLSRLKKLV